MTVADLAREWLTHLENNEGTKGEGTILRLRPRVTEHIIPADRIGGHRLDTLTVASLMVDADVPLREVADLLGPKDVEMVVKRYRHRVADEVDSLASAERVEQLGQDRL